MKILGLASSPCCGKTTVAAEFRKLGAKIIDADRITHSLYKNNPSLRKKIAKEFGKEFVTKTKVRTKALGELVFSSPAKLKKLNSITHPKIIREIKSQIAKYKKSKRTKIIVLDVPLLIEANLHKLCDIIVVVKCNRSAQLKRFETCGIRKKGAMQRIKAQEPLCDKVKLARYLIDTNGTLAETRSQVKEIWSELL